MSYIDKGIKYAVAAATNSNCPNYKMGAVLMKRNKLISVGRNIFRKSHPKSKTIYNGIHAEFNCLHGIDPDKCKNNVLFVVRITNAGQFSMARPCKTCRDLLIKNGIKAVYYTNYDGEVVKEIIK